MCEDSTICCVQEYGRQNLMMANDLNSSALANFIEHLAHIANLCNTVSDIVAKCKSQPKSLISSTGTILTAQNAGLMFRGVRDALYAFVISLVAPKLSMQDISVLLERTKM